MPDEFQKFPSWVDPSHFWSLLEDRSAGTFYWDRQQDAVHWSPKLLTVLGHTSEHISDFVQVEDLMHPSDKAAHGETLGKAIELVQSYTIEIRLRNAQGVYQLFRAEGFWPNGEQGLTRYLMGYLTKIDDMAVLRNRVSQTERLYQAFFDRTPAAIYMKNKKREHIYGNAFAAKIAGCTVDEFIGKTTTELFGAETDQALIEVDRRILEDGETVVRHGEFKAANGELHYVYDTSFPIEDPVTGEKLIGGVGLDTTRQHLAETAVARSQKMEALGMLVGGIAHDFNNTLAVLQGNVELIELSETDEEVKLCLSEIANGVARGARLTKQLLAYARKSILHSELLNLNDIINDADRLLRRTLPESIDIETVSGGGLWNTVVDKAELESTILNLAFNARDAMPAGGKITIETSNVRIDEDYVTDRGEQLAPGRFVLLAFTDTGHGMPDDVLSRAFDPFFTTKPVDEGTGMGLSMVEGLMRQIGGIARLYSEPRVGTTVKLYFPASSESKSYSRSPEQSPKTGTEHILLAEDDDNVRDVLRRQLGKLGYRVTEAINGDTAIKLLHADPTIELLVTDIVMPGQLQGPDLAKQARKFRPDLPVVFMSGYPREAAVHGNGLRPDDINLLKPTSAADLARSVRSILDRT